MLRRNKIVAILSGTERIGGNNQWLRIEKTPLRLLCCGGTA